MNRFEIRKKAIEQTMREHVDAVSELRKTAKEDGNRDFTEDERIELESHVKALEDLKEDKAGVEESIKTLERVDDLGRQLGPSVESGVSFEEGYQAVPGGNPVDRMVKSLGQQFIEAKSVQDIHEKYKNGSRERFNTGSIELKGTLLEGSGAPGSGTGGGLIPVPQVVPGVVEKLFQPLRIRELILDGQANTSSIRYVVEGTATSGAAGVAEGAAKPQSTLALSTKDMPVTKVATSLKVSDEMLEDVQQVQSYINGRLSLFIDIEEERQIVLGAGSSSNELAGIAGAGVNAYGRGTVDSNAVALFKAMNGQRGSAFLEPDWIVMNPANWQTTRLATDSAGQFQGGGPFLGQYGNGANLQASGQITGVNDAIWNKPVIVTTAIGAGTALIGTRAAAQLWLRGGLSVEATNANEDDFLHNLVAIRAEKREALTVFRPSAFTLVSGLA